MHDNRNMIIHIGTDIPQKARRKNTHSPKRNARIINILITIRERDLASEYHHLVGGLVRPDAGDGAEGWEERGACVFDGVGYVR